MNNLAVDDDDIKATMMEGSHLRGNVSKAMLSGEYNGSDNSSNELVLNVMDEDEAEEAMKYVLGVF